jgi:hypothetical protein
MPGRYIGITVLYALTAIISFALLPLHQDSLPANYNGLSCVVFGVFNVRKKKAFAENGKYQYGSFLRLLYDKDNSRLWTIGIYSFLFCLWN